MILPVQRVRPGQQIKGNREFHGIRSVRVNPSGCWFHVHVELDDKRRWCYDIGEEVEVQ